MTLLCRRRSPGLRALDCRFEKAGPRASVELGQLRLRPDGWMERARRRRYQGGITRDFDERRLEAEAAGRGAEMLYGGSEGFGRPERRMSGHFGAARLGRTPLTAAQPGNEKAPCT